LKLEGEADLTWYGVLLPYVVYGIILAIPFFLFFLTLFCKVIASIAEKRNMSKSLPYNLSDSC
jgi:uncharacterized protein (DUF2062 family)